MYEALLHMAGCQAGAVSLQIVSVACMENCASPLEKLMVFASIRITRDRNLVLYADRLTSALRPIVAPALGPFL